MTNQQKIDHIRAKAIEANPDILKLEFGCRFIQKSNTEKSVFIFLAENTTISFHSKKCSGRAIWWSVLEEGRDMSSSLLVKGCENEGKEVDMSGFEILGRPIGLADILLAIGQDVACVGNGCLLEYSAPTAKWVNREHAIWNLEKDNLELQEEATIDFIYNLLASEEK